MLQLLQNGVVWQPLLCESLKVILYWQVFRGGMNGTELKTTLLAKPSSRA